jgi:hypothetical protein
MEDQPHFGSEAEATGRPESGEYSAHAQPYLDRVEGNDAVVALARQRALTVEIFGNLDESAAGLAYAPGKWTLRQILGHLSDDERIFAYRALCIARGDTRPLAGFDENAYAGAAGSESRSLVDLLAEYESVRSASITLFQGLDREAWLRMGTVEGYSASPRGLAFHIAGHELHHLDFIEQHYLPSIDRQGLASP